jgi:hypothetical protein
MSPAERRRERRLDVDVGATLFDGQTPLPCRLLNMCSKGFLIRSDTRLPVGQAASLVVTLYPSRTIRCTVQVRHVNAERLGALITEISDEDHATCTRFLKEKKQERDAHNERAQAASHPETAATCLQ